MSRPCIAWAALLIYKKRNEQFETFVERFLLSGDAEKTIEGMAAQIPVKPQNGMGAADNEAMLKPESATDSSQNSENRMPGTVHSAAQQKTAQSGAPAGAVINSNSNGYGKYRKRRGGQSMRR